MRVLFTTPYPSPYRMDFFNELGKHCELTVVSEENTKLQKSRDPKWLDNGPENFELCYLRQKRIFNKVICPEALEIVKNNKFDIIVVGGYSTLTEIILVLYLSCRGLPFAINTDGGTIKKESLLKFGVKKFLISKASFWLCTGDSSRKCFMHYGADEQQIYKYPFTSVRGRDISDIDKVVRNKRRLKEQLGLIEEIAVITVGQFIYRKAFDVLLKACCELDKSVGVYIIGGQATDEYINMKKSLRLEENVHFVGFKGRDELKLYYEAADIFVLPTREDIWGLVVNEAMAHGLPVITTDGCVAGLELISRENGYIVPVEDHHAIAEKINLLVENKHIRLDMARNNYNKILEYTIENMAKKHKEIFTTFMDKRREYEKGSAVWSYR